MYDMMIYDIDNSGQSAVSFGNKATIIEERIAGRIRPIHIGVNYHSSPLEFKLTFGSMHEQDRYQMQEVALWLTGHTEYQWLSIDQPDLEDLQFRCLITELKPIHVGWAPVAYEATVTCDCPYAYGYPFSRTVSVGSGTTSLLLYNEGTVREYIKPELRIVPNDGTTEFTIKNLSDGGRVFQFSGMPAAGLSIYVDNDIGFIREDRHKYNLYPYFNMNFFRLVPGTNNLEITGRGTVTITGRFLYNTAG
jgi:phage-related protein